MKESSVSYHVTRSYHVTVLLYCYVAVLLEMILCVLCVALRYFSTGGLHRPSQNRKKSFDSCLQQTCTTVRFKVMSSDHGGEKEKC